MAVQQEAPQEEREHNRTKQKTRSDQTEGLGGEQKDWSRCGTGAERLVEAERR